MAQLINTRIFLLGSACLVLLATGCRQQTGAPQNSPPPAAIPVVTVEPKNIDLISELPGRIEATRNAQVRARVAGIVLKRVFQEGSQVNQGDVLFQIDPAPFKATYTSAQASLSKAEANLAQADLKWSRYQQLLTTKTISKQDFDDASTARQQAAAELEVAKAAVVNARLNLEYATVTAPISGYIGRAFVTEGALVGQGEATPLADIQTLDPIYVTFTQSSAETLRLRRALLEGQMNKARTTMNVTLITADNLNYPQVGQLLFSDLTVDERTDTVTLRAEFKNPDHLLLPGMYVRVRLLQGVSEQTLLVPQQAVLRTPEGAVVWTVTPENKVRVQAVATGSLHEDQWIITTGLQAGDRVVVEGFQKTKPDAIVQPVPWVQP